MTVNAKSSTAPPAKARAQRSTAAALKALRESLGVEVTEADKQTARQLNALYHSKTVPPIIKHALFNIFWDMATKLYHIPLPTHFDRKWLPVWATLAAVNRMQGHMPTTISYTWQPDEKESAELDAEEEEESYARHIFGLMHDKRISEGVRGPFVDGFLGLLEPYHPFNCFETFRVALPLLLAAPEPEEKGGDDDTNL